MASEDRSPAPHLIEDLLTESPRYAFFRAVEILLKEVDQSVQEDALRAQERERILFRVAPSLGFAASDVIEVETRPDHTADDPAYAMTVSFLGLHGSSSPLPGYFLDASVLSKGQESVQQGFNDFFSNRLIWLLYLIWRKYRYYIRYEAEGADQFSRWMFSLAGIGGEELRGEAGIPWAKLLTYIGLIAARNRSERLTSGVIAHAFDLEHVEIEQCKLRKVEIPVDQRMQLGRRNTTLGHDGLIGQWVQDRKGKFAIVLHDLSFDRFMGFLPGQEDHERLKELVEFLLKDQFSYDIDLRMKPDNAPSLQIGSRDTGYLGWTSFIGDTKGKTAPMRGEGLSITEDKRVVIQARA